MYKLLSYSQRDELSLRNNFSIEAITEIIAKNKDEITKSLLILYADVLDIVKKFIIDKKRKLYGGLAIHTYLQSKGDKGIYSEDEFPDYDFYSPTHIIDATNLTNEIYKLGYKHIRYIPALHPNTVRIQLLDLNVYIADITYLPKKYYDIMSTFIHREMHFVDVNILKIPLYKTLGVKIDYYRWKKDFARLSKLLIYSNDDSVSRGSTKHNSVIKPNKYKLIADINHAKNIDKKIIKENVFKIIQTIISDVYLNKNPYCGQMAHLLYKENEKMNTLASFNKVFNEYYIKGKVSIIEYAIIDANILKNAHHTIKIIKDFGASNNIEIIIQYKVYAGMCNDIFLGQKHVIYINKIVKDSIEVNINIPIEILYDFYGICINVIDIGTENIRKKVVNYYFAEYIFYSYLMQIRETTHRNIFMNELRNIYNQDYVKYLISDLRYMKDEYYKKHATIGIEKTIKSGKSNIFQVFSDECSGTNLNITMKRAYQKVNKLIFFPPLSGVYEPNIKKIDDKKEIESNQKKVIDVINELIYNKSY